MKGLLLAVVLTISATFVLSAQQQANPVTLNIMSTLMTEKEAPLEQAMADQYMKKNPNVKIVFIGTPVNDISKKIIALNSSNDLPDAFFMPTEFMSQAKDMGIIVDHEKLLGADWIAGLNPNVVDSVKMNGQMMVVPWHMIPVALIYRIDWLKEAGMVTINTWDDFTKAAKAFTKDTNGDKKIDRWGFSMVGTRNGSGEARFTQIVRSFGVNEVYKDSKGKWTSDLTTDKFAKGLQYFVDLNLKDGVVPPGATETGYPEAAAFFAQEKTGLMVTGSNAIGAIESTNPALKGKLGSVPIPMAERHVTNLQTSGYAITTACKNPSQMIDYLKFITQASIAVDFGQKSGRMPVTKIASADPAFKTLTYQGFIDCMQYAIPQPAFPNYGEVIDTMGEAYNTMMGNKIKIDAAMAQVKTRITSVLADNNK